MRAILFLIAILFIGSASFAIDRVSVTSGNWGTAGTWSPSGIPAAGDNITITATHVISLNVNGSCNNLTVNGTASWTASRTINAGGSLTINNGGSIVGSSTGTLNVAGTLTVPAGAGATIGRTTISIGGSSSISGTLTINNATGSKTFSDVTIGSTGTWTSTVAEDFTFNGNVVNNGSFLSNTGSYTLAGAVKTLSGANTTIFDDVSFTGTYTNSGTLQINTNFGGAGTLTQGASANLILGDPTPTGNLVATAAGNTVRYLISTGNQNVNVTNYANLIFENTGTGTINGTGAYTVNGNIDALSGIATLGSVTLAGNLNISSGATVNVQNSPNYTGTVNINGTLNVTGAPGTKTFNDIIVSSTGTWNSSVAESYTINGNISCSGTFTSNTGTYTLAGAAKTISGTTLSISNVTVSGSYTNNGTFTVGTALSGAGSLTQGANSILNIGGTSGITTLNASTNTPNTVNYNGAAAQTIKTIAYYNLQVSKTGGSTGTFGGNTTVNNDFTVSSGIASLGAFNITVSGTTSVTGTFTHTSATGTKLFNTIVMNSGGTWNGTAAATFAVSGSITMSGGTINATTAPTFNVTGGITSTAATTSSIGIAAMNITGASTINGTLQITSATGAKIFGDLTVASGGTWNATVSVPFTINGNLSNSGTFTANTGIYTLAGAVKTISGTISIPNTTVTGSYTNNGTFSSTTSLLGAGTFAQGTTGILNLGITSGNFSVTTFNASASGNTVNYNLAGAQNVRVPGDGSYHHLALAGTGTKTLLAATDVNGDVTISSTLTANNFDMTVGGNWSSTGTFTPGTNTVTFDGAAQNIGRTGGETFNHLTAAGSGTKTLTSDITTNGNLTISSIFDVTTSNYAVNVKGNWVNNGTFAQQSGTVTFNGSVAQTIGGSTITNFNNLAQSNAAGVSLANDANLINALTISSGTFTTTGFNFTLKSDANGTARIASIPGGANFAGNIIMERYTGTGPTDWRFLCSNVSGADIETGWDDDIVTSGFTGSDFPSMSFKSIYTYDETLLGNMNLFGFQPATSTLNSISNGKGFWVYLGPTPVTIDVTGAPNKFSQSPTITFTNSGSSADDGWNMVSNPYPSAIDWDAASWTKTNLDNAVYIYNSYTGSFASYVGGVGVNGGSRYIPSSQAFWVKTNAASPGITADENVKASPNPSFLKMIHTPNTSNIPMAFKDFPIPQNTNNTPNSLTLVGANANGKEDETFIRFMSGATNDFDGNYDAWKMWNLDTTLPNISSIVHDTSDLAINSLPDLSTDISIKIRYTVSVSGNYSIRRDSILMLPMSACIFLEDLANGNMTDLRQNISYSFFISDTTSAPRFLLHIYAPITKQVVNTGCGNDSSGIAIAKGTGSGPWNYTWTNSTGDTLQANYTNAADSLSDLPAGIYYVTVSGSACGTVTDSMEIKSSSNLSFVVNYTDVSCNGGNDGSAFAYVISGSSPFAYQWSNGETNAVANNLSAGSYSVVVTEAGGCSQTEFVIISQPGILTAGFISSTDTVDLAVNNSVSFTNNSSGATNYLWNFGDGSPNDTAANPVHYYSSVGTYTVMMIASSGTCADTSYKVIEVINNPVAVYESSNHASVNVVYENGIIYLDFDLAEKQDALIAVYNSLGEKIISQQIKSVQKNQVALSSERISEGVYLSVIDLNGKILTRRFVISSR